MKKLLFVLFLLLIPNICYSEKSFDLEDYKFVVVGNGVFITVDNIADKAKWKENFNEWEESYGSIRFDCIKVVFMRNVFGEIVMVCQGNFNNGNIFVWK